MRRLELETDLWLKEGSSVTTQLHPVDYSLHSYFLSCLVTVFLRRGHTDVIGYINIRPSAYKCSLELNRNWVGKKNII